MPNASIIFKRLGLELNRKKKKKTILPVDLAPGRSGEFPPPNDPLREVIEEAKRVNDAKAKKVCAVLREHRERWRPQQPTAKEFPQSAHEVRQDIKLLLALHERLERFRNG
jgi:hypothetical protein